ncbi:flavodoxin family protein [Blastococcus sp. TF02A-26]|uniref:flavodoxin family protein n=1 Tax=Blastococcus sp. TF02A-26 TaxID=2250577 RepID=UPI000DE8E52B|nr:flavodoxin family protein [Blastococcus sp. TF02A-26]RBY83394.1 flavodoxin [Blastococcus sp. TF02A-26]
MTRALVVYESVFGNGRTIAHAIADGLSGALPVDVVAADGAPAELGPDVGLLVVGGPNHGFSMPRPATRQGAVDQHGAHVADTDRGLHEWLDAVRVPRAGIRAAAYDTRSDHPKLLVRMDHAARTEEKLLRGLGLTILAPAEHFSVTDVEGPLADGEEDRAREWGATLARALATAPVHH